jgi:predicted amidohydrolase YtcJ
VIRILSLALLLGITIASPAAASESADRLIVGRIYARADAPAPVSGLAIDREGRVIATGEAAALREQLAARGEFEEIILEGTVIPGLIDAHGHLLGLGFALQRVDLVGARSIEEVIERVRAKAGGADEWLLGRGWDQNRWPEQVFPTRVPLDAAFPGQPVWLERVDGHAGWANTRALELAGITRETPDPEGGRIERDEEGEPTGVLIDTAMALVDAKVPAPGVVQKRRAYEAALAAAARAGLTAVHDAGVSREDLLVLRSLADDGRLPIRVYAMADGDGEALALLCREGAYAHPSGRLEMRAVKLYADGALGSRGAALLAPYADAPGQSGLLIQSEQRLQALVKRAIDCQVQPAVHAIGDRANRAVLAAFAQAGAETRAALRPRIEHAQVVDPDDIARFAALGVIASMQPTHATSDMPWAEARLGPSRLRGAYAWRRFLAADVSVAFGSDFPVERVEPLHGLYAALTRQDADGHPEGGWLPDQRLGFAEALAGFTLAAAHAGHAEDELGSLEPGKRADFVVLSADPYTLKPRGLLALTVRSTWLDGRKVEPSSTR